MWNAIKYAIKACWPMELGILIVSLCFLAIQKRAFFGLTYEQNNLIDITFPMKSWMFIGFLLSGCLAVCVIMQYLNFSVSKVRLMLMRDHRVEFMFGYIFLVFVIFLLCYMMLSYLLKEGLYEMISYGNPKASEAWKNMVFQDVITHDELSLILVMNLRNTGRMLLWLFSLSLWTNACAVSQLLRKRGWLDMIVISTILPLVISIFHWSQIPISILLCIGYIWYIDRCWNQTWI
ncbi:hypothetical protein [[Eubacterium] hominis]|uniref:hypothetical protein n=1 Tax=[Eubacterium] hominis TaxID=2764325 RepID=UPI003A4E4780